MSTAERIIDLLQREKANLEAEISTLEQKNRDNRELLFDSIQIISDLLDDDCPEQFKDVALEELKRFREEYLLNY